MWGTACHLQRCQSNEIPDLNGLAEPWSFTTIDGWFSGQVCCRLDVRHPELTGCEKPAKFVAANDGEVVLAPIKTTNYA
jgi:hypothetical protein